jgi:hypothetical protein
MFRRLFVVDTGKLSIAGNGYSHKQSGLAKTAGKHLY